MSPLWYGSPLRFRSCRERGARQSERRIKESLQEIAPERRIDVPIVFLSHSSRDADVAQSLKGVLVRLRKGGDLIEQC